MLLLNRFVGEALYILDEPEASLSPQRQLSVLTRIHDLVQHNSQFIVATHSPILMAYPNSTIYNLSAKGIEQLDYYRTEHFQVTATSRSNRSPCFKAYWKRSPKSGATNSQVAQARVNAPF